MTARRVLFVEANEDGSVGGSHQVLYDMVRFMDRTRYEPVILFYQDNRFHALFKDAGFRVITWDALRTEEIARLRARGGVAKALELARVVQHRRAFIRDEGIDLVHMNNSPRSGRADWLPAARLRRVPIVASARGDAERFPGTSINAAIHRRLLRGYDRVVAVSEYIAEGMRAQHIPAHKVVVVHDGVDPAKIAALGQRPAAELRAALRAELGVPDGKVFVAAVGNLRAWKGQHVVLQALATLKPAQRAPLCVVFVGGIRAEDEDYVAGLHRLVAEHGLADCVRFAGSRTDVPDIMSVADMMVHSSTTPEPGGTVVIESMTFGAPVVVASRGGHLDYLQGQDDLGLVHDVEKPEQLAAHLVALAADPARRARMSAGAKVRAREFSIERTARKMEAVYDGLLAGRR